MLVGNDVVDLRDPENQPDALHPRFDERVFVPAERARLALESTMHVTRWRMWAAKESAFKVARKLDAGVRFLPRQFTVRLVGNARAVVDHAVGRFDVSFSDAHSEAHDWVHAIATWSDRSGVLEAPTGVIARVHRSRTTAVHASSRVRTMARNAVGSMLSIAPAEIEIARVGRVPVALRRMLPLPVDLSLSHHGRFLACALTRKVNSI